MTKVANYLSVLIILFMSAFNSFAQELKKSNTYVDTYYQGEKHLAIQEGSYIIYSPGNAEIYIVLNFAELKFGVDSLDEWLLDLSDSKLVFKGHLPAGNLLHLSHHNTKALEIQGQITFNGQTRNHTVLIHFYEVSREAKFFMNNGHDYFDRVYANIQFTFLPKEFGIQKKPHHLKKKVSVAIGRGIINEYRHEHEIFLK